MDPEYLEGRLENFLSNFEAKLAQMKVLKHCKT
jgi:hypothetical protein